MTDQVSENKVPNAGTELNDTNKELRENADNTNRAGADVGDVNNNKGDMNGEVDAEHPDGRNMTTNNGRNGIDNNGGTGDVNVVDRLDIEDKDPEEIDQFDSVSNAVSQHGQQQQTNTAKRKEVIHLPQEDNSPKPEAQQTQRKPQQDSVPTNKPKKVKKSVFVSYSPDAGYLERKFVVETVKQLKENNLAEDIWFDKDESNTGSPCWFSLRMEAVEKCRAAILFLSDSYFQCPVSVYEGKTLLERTKSGTSSVAIFPILFGPIEKSEPHRDFVPILKQAVDLTGDFSKLSLAEKTSIVIGTIMESLEKFAIMNLPLQISTTDSEFTGNYKKKKICQWDSGDLQEWLFKLGIKEFYRQSLAENMVDGFLLMSLTDHDMINQLSIDSRVVRKKIMQNILVTLDKEHKLTDNWHLRARAQRAKPDVVYMIYDPADVRLAQNMKMDLRKKNLQV